MCIQIQMCIFCVSILIQDGILISQNTAISSPLLIPVIHQPYDMEPSNEYVVYGNDAILRCKLPSHVADHVDIVGWQDSEGGALYAGATPGKRLVWNCLPFFLPLNDLL